VIGRQCHNRHNWLATRAVSHASLFVRIPLAILAVGTRNPQ
jgi:hypothetical protein